MLQEIDSWLNQDSLIQDICQKKGPMIRRFIHEECQNLMNGAPVPATFEEQMNVLVRDFHQHHAKTSLMTPETLDDRVVGQKTPLGTCGALEGSCGPCKRPRMT